MSRDVEMGYRAVHPAEAGMRSTAKNTLHFDVSYYVTQKDKKRMILDRVSDIVQSGEMLAIMGRYSHQLLFTMRVVV